MYKYSKIYMPIVIVLMLLSTVLVFISLLFDYTMFLLVGSVTLIVFVIVALMLKKTNDEGRGILGEIADGILLSGENGFIDLPIPVITVYDNNEIIWCNDICIQSIFEGEDVKGENISIILPDINVSQRSDPKGIDIEFNGRKYTVFIAVGKEHGSKISIIYLIDDDSLKETEILYHSTRPCVAMFMVDNYEELMQDYKESERTQLMGKIELTIDEFITSSGGFVTRVERDRFIGMFDEKAYGQIVKDKFRILDKVREIAPDGRMCPTLSIGIGRQVKTFFEAEHVARQALDMCLGRGGDQAAVKAQAGFEFYGGVSRGIEKRTKVKTRIISAALSEIIQNASNVIIMGHSYADLDCLGSGVGMLCAVRSMDKKAVICINREKNLAKPLLDKLMANGYNDNDFVDPQKVLELVGENTLLIVVDTHVPEVLESKELYNKCKNVAVIDHHRKLVSYINNAVIFYHEPFASSASEMVTELIQYFPSAPQIKKMEAEALLSGIMLDTKNFILRTGVRTFEAAAYLRRKGADTMNARKMFSPSIELYQQKTEIISSSEVYRDCGISAYEKNHDDIKIIAAQAADELITLNGVSASFVVFKYGKETHISARSMGNINVQIIMEKLGGGGHHTMAAAQLKDADIKAVKNLIKKEIDQYYDSYFDDGEQETKNMLINS